MGGTYFPKFEKGGLPSFKTVMTKVSEAYKENKDKLKELATKKFIFTNNEKIKEEIKNTWDVDSTVLL